MTIEVTLPEPHPAQKTILDSQARFRVLMCGRRFGKSLISQAISIDESIEARKVAYITPTYQLGKIFFKEILENLPAELYKKNEQDLLIEFITGGSIRFFTGENLDAMRGLKFHLAIIDEASFIVHLQDGWLSAIRPTLTDYKGRAIFLSTPRGKNYFYSLYLNGGSQDWEAFKFSTYDNPYIDASEIDDAKKHLPKAVFEQEYMANPMENAANPFGIEYITHCIRPMSSKTPKFYGIDLAKSVDWTVIIGLDEDGAVAYFDRFQKDWHQTKAAILRLDRDAAINIDSTGVGDAIVEDLQKGFTNMYGFKFTSSSKQQLMLRLVDAVHNKTVFFPAGPIQDELEVIEYQYSATGVKYGAPSGFHDDCVMSLALAVNAFQKLEVGGQYSFGGDPDEWL
jgi:voltage-gated potassium channel Kch